MAGVIDVSDRGALQGGGGVTASRILKLIVAQAVADSSSAVAIFRSREAVDLRYEAGGAWHEMVPPSPMLTDAMLRLLREKADIPVEASWGVGKVHVQTENGLLVFRVDVCSDSQGHSLTLLAREGGVPPGRLAVTS